MAKKELTQEQFNEMIFKRETTRLKNLLRNYRDHMITVYNDKTNEDIVKTIERIDNAIDTIKYAL